MKGVQLSTFQPTLRGEPGGIKVLLSDQRIIPVAGGTTGISEQATIIHKWLLDTYAAENAAILVKDVINKFGYWSRTFSPVRDVMKLKGFPLEELIDASLLYVEEPQ